MVAVVTTYVDPNVVASSGGVGFIVVMEADLVYNDALNV